MADVAKAVECVLRQEDATLSGVITDTRGDKGGKTRFGIASTWHPELLATTFYTIMSNSDALQIAILTMEKEYATPCGTAGTDDFELAFHVLSFAVNAGVRRACSTLQLAVNQLHPGAEQLALDGIVGPSTLAAVNCCYAVSLLLSFRLRMIAYYAGICRGDEEQLKFLIGWIDRAMG